MGLFSKSEGRKYHPQEIEEVQDDAATLRRIDKAVASGELDPEVAKYHSDIIKDRNERIGLGGLLRSFLFPSDED